MNMKRMLFLLGLTMVLTTALVLAGNAQAVIYNNGYPIYYDCSGGWSDPNPNCYFFGIPFASSSYSPRVACSPEAQNCLMLTYNDNAKTVYVIYSSDQFTTYPATIVGSYPVNYAGFSGGMLTGHPYYPLPYDIWYDTPSHIFYIMISGDTYNSVYIFDLDDFTFNSTALWQNRRNCGASLCGSVGCGSENCFAFASIYNKTTSQPYVFGFGASSTSLACNSWYLKNGTIGIATGCGNTGGITPHQNDARGFAAGHMLGDIWYWDDQGGSKTINNLPNFPSVPSRDGIFFWDTANIYYHVPANLTLNTTTSIWATATTTFTSYGAATPYYYMNASIDEQINMTDVSIPVPTEKVFVFNWRNNNTGSDWSGSYGYKETQYPIYIRARYDNPLTPLPDNIPVNATISLSCIGTPYSTVVSGSNSYTVNMPCTNMTANILAPGYYPSAYTYTLQLFPTCSNHYLYIDYAKSYNITIKVYDGLLNQPLTGASVSLDSSTGVTDGTGKTQIDVMPLESVTFRLTNNQPNCQQNLVYDGSPHQYNMEVSKTDYTTYISTVTLVNLTGVFYAFLPEKSVTTIPSGINLHITMHSSDGIEVSPVSAITNITGGFYQSNLIVGSTYSPNTSSNIGLPLDFILFSNTSTYNITATSVFANYTYTKTIEVTNGTNSDCINSYCVLDFVVPSPLTSFPCQVNNDCLGGTCYGNTFFDLLGCRNGACSYTQILCPSCDSRVGCYNIGTTQPCSGDQDCNKTCTSSSTATYGYCSSAGLCVYKNVNCDLNVQCVNMTINITTPGGSVISNYSAGICANHQICFSQSTSQSLFQITKLYQNIGFILDPSSVESLTKLYLDQRVSCTPTEASATARHCIQGVNVPIIENGSVPESNHIVTQVGGTSNTWQFQVNPYNSNYYRFFDVSYQCDLECELDIQFCEYGCNMETGFCYQSAQQGGGIGIAGCNQSIFIPICSIANTIVNTTTNQTLSSSLQAGGYGFVLVFLTPIFWIMMLIIGIMMVASYYTKHMEIGGVSGLLLLVVFTLYFPELIWITVVIIVVAGYLIGRQMVRVVQGG